ncbi:MAG: DUF3135 domain-containing protein [Saccharospirillum sp.]|nr:DUF3135 domain-containing protein [Saccharospirillum sp.]
MRSKYSDLPSIDTLITLAKEQPDELERIRIKLTQELIEGASSAVRRRRLEGLNFTIEMKRKTASNPMHSCLKLSELMWDSAIAMAERIKQN